MNRFFLFLLILLCLCSAEFNLKSVTSEERYAKELKAFSQADSQSPIKPDSVLFLGSSSIRLWPTIATDFPDIATLNRGFGGSTIADSIALIDRLVFPYRPRQIVFYAGDNDIAQGKTAAQVANDFIQFQQAVHKKLPQTSLVFISIKPSPSRWKYETLVRDANQLIQKHCQSVPNLRYLDVFNPMLGKDGLPKADLFVADQLHLNASGYRIWVNALKASKFLLPNPSK